MPKSDNILISNAFLSVRIFIFFICNYETSSHFSISCLVGMSLLKMLNCFLYNVTNSDKSERTLSRNLVHGQLIMQTGMVAFQHLISVGFGFILLIHTIFSYMIFISYSHCGSHRPYYSLVSLCCLSWTVMLTFGIDKTLSFMSRINMVSHELMAELGRKIEFYGGGSWNKKVASRRAKAIIPMCLETGVFGNRFFLIKQSFRMRYMQALLINTADALMSFPIYK